MKRLIIPCIIIGCGLIMSVIIILRLMNILIFDVPLGWYHYVSAIATTAYGLILLRGTSRR